MSNHIEVSTQNHPPTEPTDSDDVFDLGGSFERWFREIQSESDAVSECENLRGENSDIYIGSFPGSNCEVTFEGVLHFDGYSFGNISSPDGTLVLTRRGRIEADINVGAAVINGTVIGNINATEKVVLESHAKVTGQIYTPALSVRLGAIFDGDCVLTAPTRKQTVRQSWTSDVEEDSELLVGV